jgi:hypothetical protein
LLQAFRDVLIVRDQLDEMFVGVDRLREIGLRVFEASERVIRVGISRVGLDRAREVIARQVGAIEQVRGEPGAGQRSRVVRVGVERGAERGCGGGAILPRQRLPAGPRGIRRARRLPR